MGIDDGTHPGGINIRKIGHVDEGTCGATFRPESAPKDEHSGDGQSARRLYNPFVCVYPRCVSYGQCAFHGREILSFPELDGVDLQSTHCIQRLLHMI